MRKTIVAAAAAVSTLVLAATAAAALVPGVYDPTNSGCPSATVAKGALHLVKNCASTVDAAAGAEITGVAGQTFQSASFTLASASQCQGGSPRFIVVTSTGLYPLGCNNVTPTTNKDGSATYTFTAQTLQAAGQQVATPTGTISFVSVIIDQQGTADLKNVTFNGVKQKVTGGGSLDLAAACKNGAWKTYTTPKFRNQGQCVKFVVHSHNAARKAAKPTKK